MKNIIIGTVLFAVALFLGASFGSFIYLKIFGSIESFNMATAVLLGWATGFLSMYYYFKKKWTLYIAIGAIILYSIPLVYAVAPIVSNKISHKDMKALVKKAIDEEDYQSVITYSNQMIDDGNP
ncbi:hypothetical protein SAMN06313540_10235, partial [Epsilonproteobacteria bacterium SCGC AD-308-E02]